MSSIFFKHLYGGNSNDWGVIGFPKTVINPLRGYKRGDRVLLAVTKEPAFFDPTWTSICGKIFGFATLTGQHRPTRPFANPDLVAKQQEVVNTWETCAPIHEFWRLQEPKPYDDFASGELAKLGRRRRGHLIPIVEPPELRSELEAWLETAPATQEPVFHSSETLGHLDQLKSR